MNTKDALAALLILFQSFIVHNRCISEFKSLLKKELKGKESSFFQVLMVQLKHLADFGPLISTVDDHEKLKYSDCDIYSIHLSGYQFNVRLLVSFDINTRPYLLLAFYERSGKRKTDYTGQAKTAHSRFNELLKEEENGH